LQVTKNLTHFQTQLFQTIEELQSYKANGLKNMNNNLVIKREFSSKKEIYQALGLTALLVLSSLPLAILGMQALNLVLGNIQL
jgi:hypothetical protein